MSSKRLQRVPPWTVVLRQQLKLLQHRKSVHLLMAGTLMTTIWLSTQSFDFGGHWPVAPSVLPFVLVSLVWPFIVWNTDLPKQRRYHWAMPVSPEAHDLFRVAAGGIWLILSLLCTLFIAFVFVVVIDARLGVEHNFEVLNHINILTASLTAYLLVTPFAMLANRPIETALGLLAAALIIHTVAVDYRIMSSTAAAVYGLMFGPGGLINAFIGGMSEYSGWGRCCPVRHDADIGAYAHATSIWLQLGLLLTLVAAKLTPRR